MIVTKAIKPSKLKQDAFRLAFLTHLHVVERETKKEYEKTWSTWVNKPEAETIISLQDPGPTMVAGVGGNTDAANHWRWTNEGTPEHVILPKGDYPLKFQTGYNAKTTPGLISSKGGGPFGDVVYARGVIHPGTEARNFDEAITKVIEPIFKDEMIQALRDGRNDCGHAI
jgi:hypothetical protein